MANDINRSIKIYIDSTEAGKSIEGLEQHVRKLEAELKSLNAEDPKQAAQAKKLKKALEESNKTLNTYKASAAETERVLKNLSGATYNELIAVKNRMSKELKTAARGTDEYNMKLKHLKQVSKEVALAQKDMRVEVGCQATSWGRAADFINKYMGLIGSALAGITGITMAFAKIRDERDKLEASSANLKALTGLGDEDVKRLEDTAKRLSTTVTKEGVRIKQSAVEIDDSFAIIGSQRPELLKNAEALEKVTQDAIYLSIASKDKLEPAAKALTTVMNQMNLGADQSRRIINAIAAGSQAGAGNIQYITDAFEKSGTTANLMNIQLEQHIGLIEAVAPKYSEAAVAGNSLDKVLLKMKEKNIGYKDGVFDLSHAIEELETRFKKGESATSLFGAEHAKMAEILVMNKADILEYTEAVSGTNKAVEQAQTNSDINEVKRAQARNKMNLLAMDLIEKLNPAITGVMEQTVNWMEKLAIVADWVGENTTLIILLAIEVGLYTAAVKLNAYWEKISNVEKGKSIILEKTKLIWLKASTAAIHLHWAAMSLLNGHTKDATRSMRAFFATLGLNPVTAVAVAVAALTIGLYKFFTRATDAEKAMANLQKRIRSVESEAAQSIVKQKTELEQFLRLARDESESKERRLSAMKKINEISPEYLGGLSLEEINTEKATTAINRYIDSIYKMAKAQAAKEQLVEIEREKLRLDTNPEAFEEMIPWWEKMEVGLFGLFSKEKADAALSGMVARGRETRDKVKQSLDAESEALRKIIEGNDAAVDELLGNGPKEGDEKTIEGAVYIFRNGQWVRKVKKGGSPKDSEFKAAMDLKLKEMETAHASELALLKKQKLETEQTEQFYNLSVISSDAVYYQKRIEKLQEFLKKAGSEKIKAEINKQIVDAQTSLLDLEQKRDKEKLAVLKDNRDKRLSIEEQLYTAEKAVYEKKVAEGQLSEEGAKVLLLSLDMKYAEKRLGILKDYQSDVADVELKSGSVRAKAVEESNKAVLDADLKAAQQRSAQQKALQNLLQDFKGEFNLLSVEEEMKIQQDVLKAGYLARKEMILASEMDEADKEKALLDLKKAYEQAKTNITQEEESKRLQLREQYGLTSMKEQYDRELELLRQQHEQGLIEDEDYEKAKAQIKIKYLKSSFDYYSDLFSGAISALQDAELANIDAKYDAEIQRAGDNTEEVSRLEKEKENKKLAVQKKYAGVNFAIKVSEIIANTAVAIMQAFGQLGPIAGAIAAVAMGATGAAQIAVANAERKKVMAMTVDGSSSSGSGTGMRVASNEFLDGGYSGNMGVYEVAGVVHGQEYIVPNYVLRKPAAMNHVLALDALRGQKTNPLPGNVTGFANGGYNDTPVLGNGGADNTAMILSVMQRLIVLLSSLEGGIRAYVVASDIQKEQNRLEESRKIGSKS